MIRPDKLQPGDEIRVIAPSRSLSLLSKQGIEIAKKRLENMGFSVSFSQKASLCDQQGSSAIKERVEDLHEAFRDKKVKGILSAIGGYNSNELLPYIDYELLKENPKILCGYSDITALATGISTKTGFITYSGPHFSSFQMEGLQEYQTEYFKQCLMSKKSYELLPSERWSDDEWFLEKTTRKYMEGEWKVYSHGVSQGKLYGGNLGTFNLLQGTEYIPELSGCILFVEDTQAVNPESFARCLASLLQTTNKIKGLLIGRFQKESNMTRSQLYYILDKHPELKKIPVMYDMDFGHTQPIMTLPIGGEININTREKKVTVLKF